MIIAIDGPAASGKGTIARRLAKEFDLAYLDTGLLYRAVACAALEAGVDLNDEAAMAKIAACIDVGQLDDLQLRTADAGTAASQISAYPAVREQLLQRQRDFASRAGGAVLDGRDIGTVVSPEADAKLFITASVEVRARRRAAQLRAMGHHITDLRMAVDLTERDRRDKTRAVSPMRPAEDAFLLDTTHMSIDEAASEALRLVREAISTPTAHKNAGEE